MKTIEEIISQEPIFMNDWSDKFGVIADFEDVYITKDEYEAQECPVGNYTYWIEKKEIMKKALKKHKDNSILFASYGCANYSGDAWVLFENDGKLYEVNGGHCSCYGLEGQWNPEEVLLQELENRLLNGTFGEDDYAENVFKQELCKFLGVEFRKNKKEYW
ncbi:hypothetical protein M3664_04795 [Paenibacillus lautus]|uniref:hypothetical protein n=1 Tax=Paenibacillus lautus TaxID=1401 RepID=UPI002040F7A3|nr:hypothetical protein [Paenibacillus lautus]MCM3257100.1 hypothetical protein [Paenibacillus lautus]